MLFADLYSDASQHVLDCLDVLAKANLDIMQPSVEDVDVT